MKMKTREQYKKEFTCMLENLKKVGVKRPKIDEKSDWYKVGFLDSLIPDYKPYREDLVSGKIVGKLSDDEKMEYDAGFMDGILSANPYKEIYVRWQIKFATTQGEE